MKNVLTAPWNMWVSITTNFNTWFSNNTASLRDTYANLNKQKEQSKIFSGLTVDEENEILDICDRQNLTLQGKNILCNELYAKKLKENKTKQYFDDKSAATRELTKASVDSKDKKYSNQCDEACKISELANWVRRYIMLHNPDIDPVDLTRLEDRDLAADFVKDNPQLAVVVNEYLDADYQWTTWEFLDKVWLPTEDVPWVLDWYKTEAPINSKGSIYHEVTSVWRDWTEWNDKLADFIHADTTPLAEWEGDLWTFASNAFKSIWNIWADAVWAVINPIDTANSVIDIVSWVGTLAWFAAEQAFNWWDYSKESLQKYIDYYYPEGSVQRFFFKPDESTEAVWIMADYFKNRYGWLEEVKNALYQDPAWVLQDVADLFKGGTWIMRKVSKTSKITKAMDTVNNALSTVNKWRDLVQDTALKWASNVGYAITNTSLDDIKNFPKNTAIKWKNNMKEFNGQLTEQEKAIVQSNPYAWEQLQSMIEAYKKKWATTTISNIVDEARKKYINEDLLPKLEKVIWNVVDEWKAYWVLDKSWITLDAKWFKKIFEDTLADNKLPLDKEWKIDFSKQHLIKEDASVVNELYDKLKEIWERWEDLDLWEYRSLRKWISNKVSETWKNSDTGRLLQKVYDNLNTEAHAQSTVLAWVDEIYSKNVNKANAAKKWLVDKEWKIKPEALATKTKQTGKSTWISAEKQLEELAPWHIEKAQWFDIAANLLKKFDKWESSIANLKWIGRGAWHAVWLITGWGIWGIAGWYLWEMLGSKLWKALIKNRDVDWSKALNELNETGKAKLKEISEKIEKGWELSKTDKTKLDSILKSIPEVKESQEFLKEIKNINKTKKANENIKKAVKEAQSKYWIKS